MPRSYKLVVVGDVGCGKTSLFTAFAGGPFREVPPSIFGGYIADLQVDGKHVEIGFWDTVAQDEYDRLRPLSYVAAHVILICFAINSLDSLVNVTQKWYPEVTHFCAGLPVVLVGCKKDLRSDPNVINQESPAAPEEGMAVASKIGAMQYFECSARTGEGVEEILQYVARLLTRPRKKRRACIIL